MRARRVAVVPYTAAEMFALADDIRAYPQFLPWCAAATETRDGEKVRATLHIQYRGLKTSFTTENIHSPPSRIDMRLAAGPLKSLCGGWRFADLGDGRCRVEFSLEYHFAPGLLGAVFEKLFGVIFGKFVDCFLHRAESVSGARMQITVVSAGALEEGEKTLILKEGATVADALRAGGFLISDSQKTNSENANSESKNSISDSEKADLISEVSAGIFGRICTLDTPLSAGDRVEVYRPLENDPRESRRARAK